MKIIQGQYNQAIVYTDNIEEKAGAQIRELCDQPFVKESRIRIMPDTHAGAGCTIGTTMTIQDKIVPNLVGVDIGCGMFVSMIKRTSVDFVKLDRIIREQVPSGFEVRQTVHEYNHFVNLEDLKSKPYLDLNRARLSIGTLGGGNHFIEMNMDDDKICIWWFIPAAGIWGSKSRNIIRTKQLPISPDVITNKSSPG